jgi:hypothetical protein
VTEQAPELPQEGGDDDATLPQLAQADALAFERENARGRDRRHHAVALDQIERLHLRVERATAPRGCSYGHEYGEQYVATSLSQMLSQKSVQQYESDAHTLDTQPVGSQPGVSEDESSQRPCAHVPCGGVPLACAVQMPLMHVSVVVQVFPHEPQLLGSLVVSTHMLVQSVIPPEHWHALLVQLDPLGQTLLHCPQFWSSCVVSTQRLPQTVKLQVLASVMGVLESLGGGGGAASWMVDPSFPFPESF